jgi:hypothetical protein
MSARSLDKATLLNVALLAEAREKGKTPKVTSAIKTSNPDNISGTACRTSDNAFSEYHYI